MVARSSSALSSRWKIFLLVSLLAGLALRLIFVNDMEYKEDEQINFIQSQIIGATQPWPWLGMASGVYIPNPGMSVWVFAWLARLFHATSPTGLAHAVQVFSVLGICLLIPFALKFVRVESERKLWLWVFALSLVNPFAVFYQRKLWPEPILPLFTILMLMGYWRRERAWGALVWGFVGAWLGQIHMSGFFFAAGIFLWTLFFERNRGHDWIRGSTRWRYWVLGSTLGALPLIPWFHFILTHHPGGTVTTGWDEALQLKFWVFWFTDPLGLHLGNPLGLLRSQSNLGQIADFVRYPILAGHATYLNAIAHVLIAGTALTALAMGLKKAMKTRASRKRLLDDLWVGRSSQTAFAQNGAFWGFGLLLTLSLVTIRRYYLMVTFPLEFVTWVRMAAAQGRWGQRMLALLWASELFVSACFVGYVHVNEGSTQGDYGEAYHKVIRGHPELIDPAIAPRNLTSPSPPDSSAAPAGNSPTSAKAN